jgi:methylmalonyl-CoA/ethylmalonyl-CoA epimerase
LEETKFFKQVNQIGIVSSNVERSVKNYEEILGLPPFFIIDRKDQEALYKGEQIKFSTKTATTRFGPLQIEINEVYEGETPHTDWIRRRGEGFHHFGCYVADIEKELKKVGEIGINAIFTGEVSGLGIKFAYLDTELIFGYIYEFIQLPKKKKRKKA